MRNPFLIIRFIFFSLMIYMTILTIVFASWNVGETISSGLPAPGAPVFLILNGGALFAFIVAGLAELVSPNARTANVAFECGWTALFSTLHLGAGIAVTVTGSAILCQPATSWGICASSHLLVPVSWLSSFVVITYFFMLLGTTVAHMYTYPSIWRSTVYSVPWFILPTPTEPNSTTQSDSQSQTHSKTRSTSSQGSFIVLRYLRSRISSRIDDVENNISEPILFPRRSNGLQPAPRQPSVGRPIWAKNTTARRGLDTPFMRMEDTLPANDHLLVETRAETIALTAPQPRMAARRGIDQPFARRVDGPTAPPAVYIDGTLQVPHFDTRPLSPLQRKLTVSPVFSHKVEDQDSPIPLPKHSEWIGADSKRGRGAPRRR